MAARPSKRAAPITAAQVPALQRMIDDGSILALGAEGIQEMVGTPGIEVTHVPYRGGAPATAAVISGEVQLVFTNMSDAVGQIEGGKVRALAVTTSKRSSAAPKVPTLVEEGVPNFHTESWNGVFAPKGTPKEIVDRMAAAIAEMMKDPEVHRQMANFGSDAVSNTPAEYAAMLRRETDVWAKLVKELESGK